MKDYKITEKVEALCHTQNALDTIKSLMVSTKETSEMIQKLREVRTELADEISRWDQK